jgi:hypothetical protein
MSERSFAEWVEAARRGENEATRWLISQYEDAIRREIRFSILDGRLRRVLAETDILQSVIARFYVDLWSGQFDFEGPEQLRGLLKKMVRTRVAAHARYWKAQRRDYRRTVHLTPDETAVRPSADPSPSRIVADADLLAEFEKRLTPDEMTIRSMRRGGATWSKVALELRQGGPEAIRKRYERGLDRVCQELGLAEYGATESASSR